MDNQNQFNRPDRITHFFNRAKVTAERSTCIRRRVGAIIVKDGVELSSGYVGSPRGTSHCLDMGSCIRVDLEIPSGERYELCRSVHAEQNAIINAARTGTMISQATMYISSERSPEQYGRGGYARDKIYGPCIICTKEILNAGIIAVHMREEGVGTDFFSIERLRRALQDQEELLRATYHSQKHAK